MANFTKLRALAAGVILASGLAGQVQGQAVLGNYSVTPNLLKTNYDISGVTVYTILGSDDVLSQTPTFIFGGSVDGAGIVKNEDGTFSYLVNHEDNFAVSRVILDKNFKPVRGEYVMNSNAGIWRLCSATMATPEEHGFGPLFITCGESGQESMTHGLNPYSASLKDTSNTRPTVIPAFGRWSAENAIPLNKIAYPGKTVVILGDDDSGPNGGQVAMYVGDQGDLKNGNLSVLRRKDKNQKETAMIPGTKYDIEFVSAPSNFRTLTGSALDAWSGSATQAASIKFGRVEDLDYRKGNASRAREIYFVTTGQDYNGSNSDSSRTKWGRAYRLMLDANDPTKGTLECILSGDDKSASNPARVFYDPDNVVVTDDYVYIQEDPNSYSGAASLPFVHDARIYQYDIETKGLKTLCELDHRRSAPDSVTYNNNGTGTYSRSGIGAWEYGAMVDVSNNTGIPGSFMLSLQPHSWRAVKYRASDGGTLRLSENQASMLVMLTGIPTTKAVAPTAVTASTNCSGLVSVITPTGGADRATYRVYTAATAGTLVGQGKTITTPALTAATSYFVATVVDGMESTIRTKVDVKINTLPVDALPATIETCGEATLSAGNTGAKFLWSNGSTNQSINVNFDGKYKVTITNASGCTYTDSVQVIVKAQPSMPNISIEGQMLMSSATIGNQWYKDGIMISGANMQSYKVKESGEYSVRSTLGTCQSPMSSTVKYSSVTSIATQLQEQGISVYPNPNAGLFNINYNGKGNTQNLHIEVLTIDGKVVLDEYINNVTSTYIKQVDITRQTAGMYILRITTDKKVTQSIINKQ
ncbi:MAG: T9SS type A sorting domain-containing protein [Bacteroidota bacterium]|nr:T9SS type A sorting domain-containing protein [Bacteroidota bacterium]